jgi:hypothetical protein
VEVHTSHRGPVSGLIRKLVNAHLNIFENAEQNHVVDTRPEENDGQALVHAGFGDGLRSLANLAGFSKKNTLSTSLAGIKGIGLWSGCQRLILSKWGTCISHTQNQGTVLQIAPAIIGAPNGLLFWPNSFAATCFAVS